MNPRKTNNPGKDAPKVGKRTRSASTGKFVQRDQGKTDPQGTVVETIKPRRTRGTPPTGDAPA